MIDNIYYNYFLLLFFAAELQSGIPCRGRPKIYKIRSVIPPIKRGPLSGKGIKQFLCALPALLNAAKGCPPTEDSTG